MQVVPFIRVYRNRDDYGTWFGDPEILRMISEEEKRGYYRGVGEFHVYGKNAATAVVRDIVNFAVDKGLVLGQLPREVAEQIAWRNGAELFGLSLQSR